MSVRKAGWYLARLRAMEPAEVAGRAGHALAVRADDVQWRHARPLWRRSWEPDDRRLLQTEPLLERPLGILDADRAGLVRRQAPAAVDALLARAEKVLAGRVELLGYPAVTLAEPVDADFDPFSGQRWPDRHGRLLDYREAVFGDPKWIWELGRCQELPLLTLAWRLTAGERFAKHASRRMLAWVERPAPGRGIAWSNGFESALRAMSFALCYDGLRGSGVFTDREARGTLRMLWQHARFTLRNLSAPSSANNHLVGELAGLATVGLLAPELRDAAQFRETGLAGLAREAERQVLADGTGAEQAFAYHLFVLDLLLLAAALAERRGAATPPAITEALARGGDAVALQVAGNEPDPTYGDSDDGRAFVLDGAGGRTARGVAAALAACLGHPGARRLAGAPDPSALVLFGSEGLARFDGAAEVGDPDSGLLAESGLVVLRRGVTRALVDAGPLGYLSIAAHGHADALQVTLADGDLELVIDPGTGSYFGNRERRTRFRGTGFHATVAVDGLDQADQAGPFLWRRHYRSSLATLDLERGVVVAAHDGYRRLPDPVHHRRAVIALEDGSLLVYDRLDARERHRYVQTWPLHPSLDASPCGDIVEVTLDHVPRLVLAIASTRQGKLDLVRGATGPLAGWSSRRLEQMEPAWTARHEVECTGGVELAALLLVCGGRTCPDPKLALADERGVARIEFVHGGELRTVEIDLDDPTEPVRGASGPAPHRAAVR